MLHHLYFVPFVIFHFVVTALLIVTALIVIRPLAMAAQVVRPAELHRLALPIMLLSRTTGRQRSKGLSRKPMSTARVSIVCAVPPMLQPSRRFLTRGGPGASQRHSWWATPRRAPAAYLEFPFFG